MLSAPEQVIGLVVGSKFKNRKGAMWRKLIGKRKTHGVSDGFLFRHSSPDSHQSHFAKKV
jgi:hypothetical protein